MDINIPRNSTAGMFINKDYESLEDENNSVLNPIIAIFNDDYNLLDNLKQIFSFDEISGKINENGFIEVYFYCQQRLKMIKTIIKKYTFCSFDINDDIDDNVSD